MARFPIPAAPGRRAVLAALPATALPLRHPGAQPAANWPDRRVRLIAPAVPGSALDLVTRLMAERLGARWGQQVIVEGRPGGDGVPALETMLRAPPGDALLLANHGVMTVTPILNPRLGFDPMAEMPAIADLTADQFSVVVPASLPVRDLAGLVGHARARPGALNYTAAQGPPYLAVRAFLRDAGLDMVFVAYRGVGSATVAEMVAGRLHAMMTPIAPIVGAVRDGQLRAIAVTGPERAPALPDVATSTEQDFPAFRQEGIHGLFGWKGMADPLRERIAAEAGTILADPALAERLRATGLLVRGGTPEGFAATLGAQRRHWAALAREFGTAPPS